MTSESCGYSPLAVRWSVLICDYLSGIVELAKEPTSSSIQCLSLSPPHFYFLKSASLSTFTDIGNLCVRHSTVDFKMNEPLMREAFNELKGMDSTWYGSNQPYYLLMKRVVMAFIEVPHRMEEYIPSIDLRVKLHGLSSSELSEFVWLLCQKQALSIDWNYQKLRVVIDDQIDKVRVQSKIDYFIQQRAPSTLIRLLFSNQTKDSIAYRVQLLGVKNQRGRPSKLPLSSYRTFVNIWQENCELAPDERFLKASEIMNCPIRALWTIFEDAIKHGDVGEFTFSPTKQKLMPAQACA